MPVSICVRKGRLGNVFGHLERWISQFESVRRSDFMRGRPAGVTKDLRIAVAPVVWKSAVGAARQGEGAVPFIECG